MNNYSIEKFVEETVQSEAKNDFYQLESPYLLELNLNQQTVFLKNGSMVAYYGDVKFTREGLFNQGIGNMLKKAVSGEGTSLMTAAGTGKVYAADCGKLIRILYLENESICINGNDVLSYEQSLKYDIKLMKSMAGIMGGGLFQVKLTGTGHVAMTTYGIPTTLLVKPGLPVFTDPNATVAWAGNLTPTIKTDLSFKNLIGRGSGEGFQLKFEGDGWVIIQPYEEVYHVRG